VLYFLQEMYAFYMHEVAFFIKALMKNAASGRVKNLLHATNSQLSIIARGCIFQHLAKP